MAAGASALSLLPAPAAELPAEVRARAEALERAIAELDRRIADDRAATHSLACPPGQRIREGALPVQTAALPVPPSLSAPDGSLSAPLTAIGTGALADRLEQATALVLSENSVGTGFFVAPNLMVTNRHVVEDATDGRVFIASRSLGGARPGVVLRATPPGQPGSVDLALIRLTDGVAPAILGLTPVAPKLTPVVAAGYHGLILQNDTGFRRLVAGDARATPDLNLTQGVVQSVQESPPRASRCWSTPPRCCRAILAGRWSIPAAGWSGSTPSSPSTPSSRDGCPTPRPPG